MAQLQSLNKLSFHGNRSILKGKIKLISSLLRQILSDHSLHLDSLEINLIDDAALLKINQDTLKHDYYTDIITFDYSQGAIITGDIYISIDRVIENAKTYKTTSHNELLRVIIHGVLHLSGYKDKGKLHRAKMTEMENKYLAVFYSNGFRVLK